MGGRSTRRRPWGGNGPHRHGPVAGLRDYAREVAVYTRGQGRLSCVPAGYFPCAEAEAVIEAMGYDPERDVENTADSVFCSHGAGVVIPWREVAQHAQVDSGWRPQGTEPKEAAPAAARQYLRRDHGPG